MIENDLAQLSKPDPRSLLEWLEDVVEDELEFPTPSRPTSRS